MKFSRRHFLQGVLGTGVSAAAALGYMRWGEADWFESTITACFTGTGGEDQPLRVLHLSDFHASDVVPLAMISRAVELGLATNPDLIVLTGDFWTDRYHRINAYAEVLRPLAAAAPAFACWGNHDGGGWAARAAGWPGLDPVRDLLGGAGIQLLDNTSARVECAGRTVRLVGTGDWWAGQCHPTRAFAHARSRAPGELRLVLSHNPDAKAEFDNFDWDLMCCGHTHGGQLKVPVLGNTPFAPVQDHTYVAGLNPWKGRQIFTTRGVGNLHGIRFNCRPEISLLLVS